MIKINKDGKYVEEKQSGESRARAIAQNGNEGLHYEDTPVPNHYSSNKDYDLIDVIGDYGLNFNRGNVVKYVFRAGKKLDELDDLKKAKDYLEREIEKLSK
tara:strand:- start:464 stop:766 length:303 start_codon:yes stop_codon:yes gene_type:complete